MRPAAESVRGHVTADIRALGADARLPPRLLAGRAPLAAPAAPTPNPAAAAAAAPDCTMTDQAFVTLTTNDAYAKGALVLGSSLKQHRTTRRLVVLATPQVSDSMRRALETIFDEVIMVDVLDSGDSAHLTLMKRPELGVTLTKLHCWSLTQYSKCVFMDADTLVLTNIDDLFEREELSAAPDPGWPDCFNSGVFVYQPSVETYNQLLRLASEQGSFDAAFRVLLMGRNVAVSLLITSPLTTSPTHASGQKNNPNMAKHAWYLTSQALEFRASNHIRNSWLVSDSPWGRVQVPVRFALCFQIFWALSSSLKLIS
ncbi:glycogenin-1 isoform X3 [Ictidomys tridecemlineatus]